MSKFKVGDRVRIIACLNSFGKKMDSKSPFYELIGKESIIEKISISAIYPYELKGIIGGWKEEELELVSKFKIGDRVKCIGVYFEEYGRRNNMGTITGFSGSDYVIEFNDDEPYKTIYSNIVKTENEKRLELVEESLSFNYEQVLSNSIVEEYKKYNWIAEDSRDGIVGETKKVMSSIKSFVKRLTLSADDKVLREYGLQNECGDFTDEARELVITKLTAENKAYLVEIANKMKEEEEKK